MALFVRVLRLAMLFFNVYDSYKILKLPPPSVQNKGRPSLRAMSQRKRDMKGCLAVWIVWSCFVAYERFAESILSLFIPFYDEFKSLAMLFMIMTRARGAEPIYLHIIRPFLKPYTSTIDQLLDFAHVIGDVIFGLAALPFIYVIQWWQRRFGTERKGLDTETETSSSASSPIPNGNGQPSLNHAKASKKPVKPISHRTSKSSLRPTIEPRSSNLTNKKTSTQPKPSSISSSKDATARVSAVHDLPSTDNTLINGLPVTDDWREYPAFPSAYPPTPLTKQDQVKVTTSVHTGLYPTITEESAIQDFRSSLLLLHDDSDYNHAGGLSDENKSHEVQLTEKEHITFSISNADDSNASDESMDIEDDPEYESESEDEFNVTLRTPDPPIRILTHLGTTGAFSKEPSPLSLSTIALTTADNQSSVRTPSTETSASDDAAIPPTLAGQKRTFQPSTNNVRLRTPRRVARGTSVKVARSTRSPVKRGTFAQSRQPQMSPPPSEVTEYLESETMASSATVASHGTVQAAKRRRVSASAKTTHVAEAPRGFNGHTVSGTNSSRVSQRLTGNRSPKYPRAKLTTKLQTLSSREGSAAVHGN